MKATIIFFLISFSSFSQKNAKVQILATSHQKTHKDTSYIYCASVEIMWNSFAKYLGEEPTPMVKNKMIEELNYTIENNYVNPIDEQFFVAKAGLVSDSILQKIDAELTSKFNVIWRHNERFLESSIVAFTHLKKNIEFYYPLDDKFYALNFNENAIVDYFGKDEGEPDRNYKKIIVHDYKSPNDFIINVKCKDSLDEIYFAKIPHGQSLSETYKNALFRIKNNPSEFLKGSDILRIPYIKFDTTVNFTELENVVLMNAAIKYKMIEKVSQFTSFDLNEFGVKLESKAYMQVVDFADFDKVTPRVLAFDQPFLIIMKQKVKEDPYFLYWVSGAEFMRKYELEIRVLNDEEKSIVGNWKFTERVGDIIERKLTDEETEYMPKLYLKNDGTYIQVRYDFETTGSWKLNGTSLQLKPLINSSSSSNIKFEMVSSAKLAIQGSVQYVFERFD